MTTEVIERNDGITVIEIGIPGPQGPPGTLIEVAEDGAVAVTPLREIDFRTGFDVTEPTSRRAQIDLDLSEVSAGGELAGTLDAPTVDATHSGSTHQSISDGLNAHLIDVVDSHDASAVSFVPTGTIVSADAQSAIVEALTDAKAYTDDGHVILSSQRGATDGVAALDATGKVPSAELPAFSLGEVFTVASEAAMLALSAAQGDMAVRTDVSRTFILSALPATVLGNWVELLNPGSPVTSVNTRTGSVTGLEEASNKGAISGYAGLDGSGYVPDAQLNPAIARDTEVSDAVTTAEGYAAAADAAHLADDASTAGDLHIRVSEPPPIIHVSTTGDDTFDGRWDQPKLTLAAAVAALGTTTGAIQLADGDFTITGSRISITSGISIRGVGMRDGSGSRGTRLIVSAVGLDMFELNGGYISFENLGLQAEATAGDIFAVTKLTNSGFRNLYINQKNPAKHIVYFDDGGDVSHYYVDVTWDSRCHLIHPSNGSVSPMFFKSFGGVDAVQFEKLRVQGGGKHFFYFEGTSSAYCNDVNLRDVTAEFCDHGIAKLLSCYHAKLENVVAWDNGTIVDDLFWVGAAGGSLSRDNVLENCGRRGGTLDTGVVDIRLSAGNAARTTIAYSDRSSLSGFKIDAGSNNDLILQGVPSDVTITNLPASRYVWIDQTGKITAGGQITQNATKNVLDTDHMAAADPHTAYALEAGLRSISAMSFAGVDPTGVADSTAGLLAAGAAAKALATGGDTGVNGVYIDLPPGIFKVTDTLALRDLEGVIWRGAGKRATQINPTSALSGKPVLSFTNYRACGVEAMHINGYTAAPPSSAVQFSQDSDYDILIHTGKSGLCRDLWIGAPTGPSLTTGIVWKLGSSGSNNDTGTVDNCDIFNVGTGIGIDHDNAFGIRILGGRICYGANAVRVRGGSFTMVGTVFENLTGTEFQFLAPEGDGTPAYRNPSTVIGVLSEFNIGSGTAAQTLSVGAYANVRTQFFGYRRFGSRPTTAMIVSDSTAGYHDFVGCVWNLGQTGQSASFTTSSTEGRFVACTMQFQTITYAGVVKLFGNHHLSTVTFTQQGAGYRVAAGETGGSVGPVLDTAILGTTPSTQAFGDAAAGGSAVTVSKNDHKHGMPAAVAATFLSTTKWGAD